MTPGGLLIGAFRKVEPMVADVTSRLTGTPGVLGRLLTAERVTRQALRTVSQLRGDVVHALLIPTTHDVADMRRELERVRSSLTEIEARLDDQAAAHRDERQ
jgi:hypothetical protein